MNTVWIKHPGTGGEAEVPEDALAQYRQSGWDLLSDEALAEREQRAAAEQAKAEARIQKLAEQALQAEMVTEPPPEIPEEEPAAPVKRKKETG